MYPNQQVAVLLYSGDFARKRRDDAKRFMVAYLKAACYFNGALADGQFAGPNAEDLIRIMIEHTRVKDPALYRKMVPNGIDPDGRLNLASMRKDLEFYRKQGYIEKPMELESAVDLTFVEAALEILGPATTQR